jgi:DNA adenine methylase
LGKVDHPLTMIHETDPLENPKDSRPLLMSLGRKIGWPSRSDVSPLRYPGGKRKLAPYVAAAVEEAGAKRLLVEPFSGGASISISLLEAGTVDTVGLCDADILVASFWQTVFSTDATILADLVRNATVNVDEWRRMRECRPEKRIDLAFKCVYLNRTSFSGSIHPYAGPMGGWNQTSNNPIGSRFNQPKIADRIEALAARRDQVAFVEHASYSDVLQRARGGRSWPATASDTFWYFDPPFFAKAGRLYAHHFDAAAHQALADELEEVPGSWILSYDDHPEATRLYGDHPGFGKVALQYTARVGSGRENKAEVVVSEIYRRKGGEQKEGTF